MNNELRKIIELRLKNAKSNALSVGAETITGKMFTGKAELLESILDEYVLLPIQRDKQWLSCKDKLPKHEEIILVYTYSGIDIFQFLADQFYHYEHGYVQNNVVTHWMPLPNTPNE